MRVWTFGGSTSEYPWPTWADIIIDHANNLGYRGENWGLCGAGNQLIHTKVMECHAKNKLGPDDWVFICFVPFFRESWFTEERGWYCPGRLQDNTVNNHRFKNIKYIINPSHYAMRDCAAISAIILSLKSLGVNFKFWFDHTLYEPDQTLAKSKKFNFDVVLDTYKDLIKPTCPPLPGIVYRKYKFDSVWDGLSAQPEIHPTPLEYLNYIQENLVSTVPWLNDGIHPQTLEFTNLWESKVRKSDTIYLKDLGWKVSQTTQWN
jgi:hypothetical protein